MKGISRFVSTMGGAGLSPFMPGTVASFLTALIIAAGRYFIGKPSDIALLFLFSVPGTVLLVPYLKEKEKDDPSEVVIDEAVGMSITLLFCPLSIVWFAAGFSLFRFFDILKPFPLKLLEKLEGAVGVMADDIGAGMYASISLLFLRALFS